MTDTFDQESWESRWRGVLDTHAEAIAQRPPNSDLVEVASSLAPGRALDAGCGHGAESLWLASAGWTVTAVDFSRTALDIGRATGVEGIDWVEGDLGVWSPEPAAYDLVVCLYVHVAGDPREMVARLAAGVAPGGTFLSIGHVDAPGQSQVTLDAALDALAGDGWDIRVAEQRARDHGIAGTDAVVRAVRAG